MLIPIQLNKYVSESFHGSEIENQTTVKDLIPFYASNYSGRQGLYSFVGLTPESKTALNDFCTYSGLGALKDQAHCTIMYSPSHSAHVEDAIQFGQSKFTANATDVRWWIGHDKVGYLVLALESDDLLTQHHRLCGLGCVPTYDEYKPHVTLAKGIVFDSDSAHRLYCAKANNFLKHNTLSLTFHEPRIEDIR